MTAPVARQSHQMGMADGTLLRVSDDLLPMASSTAAACGPLQPYADLGDWPTRQDKVGVAV